MTAVTEAAATPTAPPTVPPTAAASGPDTAAVLSAERAGRLDCVQSNLAQLADDLHGPDAHLALGAALRFRPRPGPHGLPTVEPALEDQLATAASAGLAETARWTAVQPDALAGLAREHGRLYVVADSFAMPWLPYHGQRHMEHSYLVAPHGERALVVDAYSSHTPWGVAAPVRWVTDWSTLPVSSLVLRFDPVPAPEAEPYGDHAGIEEYVAAYAAHPDRVAALDQLTTETWLLARSRALHAAFLATRPGPLDERTAAHVLRLGRLAEQAFLAFRRVQRGRPEPGGLLPDVAAALHADRELFGTPDPVRAAVAEVVADVVGVPADEVRAAPALTALPGFHSFEVVEVVEALEERFGVEFDPDDLLPENLHRLDGLCALVTAAGAAR
ncbi:Acyl carrier protein [Streptomyces sp. ADI96-02]|uniref:phosphopantetheine-binding protein n=1 Tax=Streptomyces sp. ADI96-02 TaxID=1522760 RepID=UPI000F54CBFF|nr:phosphopantetheine-binding protein [Streptomyces sp. ADI96-02]RPK65820.1 Acyl carrier protein [Streptomyces sp. ADI96-02]